MGWYEKKSKTVKAKRLKKDNINEVSEFVYGEDIELSSGMSQNKFSEYKQMVKEKGLKIETREGTMYAQIGDFILRGIRGEFYPCKPDVFKESYENVQGDIYTKAPRIVQAKQFDGSDESVEWLLPELESGDIARTTSHLFIETPDGVLKADEGDYIVKGVKGEYYPCKPDIFEESYESLFMNEEIDDSENYKEKKYFNKLFEVFRI